MDRWDRWDWLTIALVLALAAVVIVLGLHA